MLKEERHVVVFFVTVAALFVIGVGVLWLTMARSGGPGLRDVPFTVATANGNAASDIRDLLICSWPDNLISVTLEREGQPIWSATASDRGLPLSRLLGVADVVASGAYVVIGDQTRLTPGDIVRVVTTYNDRELVVGKVTWISAADSGCR